MLPSHHLKNHLRSHSDARPFECSEPDCEERFKSKYACLSHHGRKHHPATPDDGLASPSATPSPAASTEPYSPLPASPNRRYVLLLLEGSPGTSIVTSREPRYFYCY